MQSCCPTWVHPLLCNAAQQCHVPPLLASKQGQEPAIPAPKYSEDERLAPLRTLLSSRPEAPPAEEVQSLSATQLRDALLALGPLDCEWVKKVNAAEAQYWRRWCAQWVVLLCSRAGSSSARCSLSPVTGANSCKPSLSCANAPCALPMPLSAAAARAAAWAGATRSWALTAAGSSGC